MICFVHRPTIGHAATPDARRPRGSHELGEVERRHRRSVSVGVCERGHIDAGIIERKHIAPEFYAATPNAVELAGAVNTRQVQGLQTRDGRHVRAGVLFRSGHLVNICEQGYADLVKLGIVSIVDLRSTLEVTAAPDAPWVVHGTRYLVVNLPKPDSSGNRAIASR